MIDIIKITEFKSGIYVVIYNLVSPCGCTVTRKAITMEQEEEPTEEQILEAIIK